MLRLEVFGSRMHLAPLHCSAWSLTRLYSRPPLSKIFGREVPITIIWRKTEDQDAELHLGCKVERIDAQQKRDIDGRGTPHTFEKLLLATGGTPRKPSFGGDKIIYFRALATIGGCRSSLKRGQHFAVVGGGLSGRKLVVPWLTLKPETLCLHNSLALFPRPPPAAD
jgi:NAD(P)H-nitrite reductase large subunit